jgi:hypothetical protein
MKVSASPCAPRPPDVAITETHELGSKPLFATPMTNRSDPEVEALCGDRAVRQFRHVPRGKHAKFDLAHRRPSGEPYPPAVRAGVFAVTLRKRERSNRLQGPLTGFVAEDVVAVDVGHEDLVLGGAATRCQGKSEKGEPAPDVKAEPFLHVTRVTPAQIRTAPTALGHLLTGRSAGCSNPGHGTAQAGA